MNDSRSPWTSSRGPVTPNRVWAVDFQFDSTTDGRPFKIVSIIDEYTRECLGDKVDRSITGEDLIDELDRIAAQRGTYHTRECLGDKVDRSITGEDLIDELDRIAAQRGTYPNVLRCDNGPELACAAMADWADGHVGLHFIPPGEPWRNGYVESFNSRIRDECLNINSFWSLAQARVVISDWKHDYNHHRRHSALGYQAPAHYAATCTHQ
ncbi:transposase [Mycobacterium kansasii]|nr:transposase [Mycobacterium kansasii]